MTSDREQLELLISRIADGEAAKGDWDAFHALAERDAGAWKLLAQAQRDHQSLSLAVGVALHAADHVELPSREAAHAYIYGSRSEHRPSWRRMSSFAGWAVAAMLTLAWIGSNNGLFFVNGGAGGNQAGLVSIPPDYVKVSSPQDAYKLYLDRGAKEGTVLGEAPQLWMVDCRPLETGKGFEVVYVRQIVERTRADDLMRFAVDESGRPMPVRVSLPAPGMRAE